MKDFFIFSLRIALLAGAILVLNQSCVEDEFDLDKLSGEVELKPSYSLPLGHGKLTMEDIAEPDDSLVFFDPDGSIRFLIKEDSLFKFELSEIIEIPDQQALSDNFDFEPVKTEEFNTTSTIILGDLVKQLGEPEKSILKNAEGSYAPFPPIPPQEAGVYDFDEITEFVWVEFAQGRIAVELENNFPVELGSMNITVLNKEDNSEVGSFSFSNVEPGETAIETTEMEGVFARNELLVEISQLSSPGSEEEVYIDFSDNIELNAYPDELKVIRGKAVIPYFEMDKKEDMISLDAGEDIKLTVLELLGGELNYNISGNLPDVAFFELELPETKKNGEAVEFLISSGNLRGTLDLDNTRSDLTSDADSPYNKLPFKYKLYADSKGEAVEFDLSGNGISFDFSLDNVEFEYLEGDFGQHHETIEQEEADFNSESDIFDRISGEFKLNDPRVRFIYNNSFGFPIEATFDITGESGEGNIEPLNPPAFLFNSPADTTASFSDTISINRDNSNIVDFISNKPEKITLSGEGIINPGNGEENERINFLHRDSYINMGAEIELPLELQLKDFGLSDTLDLEIDEDDLEILEDAALHISAENGFPLGATIGLALYSSENNEELHSFGEIVIMSPAPVGQDGIVPEGETTSSEDGITLSKDVKELLSEADSLILSVKLDTSENGEVPVKILSTYSVGFNIKIKAGMLIK